tara:strand:+ start:46 stop:465 length:420 start_codon:yes stop_codon:yes gene_type:complete
MNDFLVKKTTNFNEIEKIIFDPEIYERIKIKGFELKELPRENTTYIGGYLKDEIIAVMVYYRRKNYTTCHVHVLKAHRARLAVKFGRESLLLRPCNVLYTNIPPKFPEVIKFAESFGFKYVGRAKSGDGIYGVSYEFYR